MEQQQQQQERMGLGGQAHQAARVRFDSQQANGLVKPNGGGGGGGILRINGNGNGNGNANASADTEAAAAAAGGGGKTSKLKLKLSAKVKRAVAQVASDPSLVGALKAIVQAQCEQSGVRCGVWCLVSGVWRLASGACCVVRAERRQVRSCHGGGGREPSKPRRWQKHSTGSSLAWPARRPRSLAPPPASVRFWRAPPPSLPRLSPSFGRSCVCVTSALFCFAS
jgi:hypothetical protein